MPTDERAAVRERLTKFINYDAGKALREKLHADAKINYVAKASKDKYLTFLNEHGGSFRVNHPQSENHPYYYTFFSCVSQHVMGDCVEECLDNAINKAEVLKLTADQTHCENVAKGRINVDEKWEEWAAEAKKRIDDAILEKVEQFLEREECELFVTFRRSPDYLSARNYLVGNEDIHSFIAMSNVAVGGFHVWAKTRKVIKNLENLGGSVFVQQEKKDD